MLKELKNLKIRNFIMLTIAGIINAIGVTVFLSPVNLYDSGISGHINASCARHPKDLNTFDIPRDFECSAVFIRTEKAGRGFHGLCNLHGCDLFAFCLGDQRYSAGRCEHIESACRHRFAALCALRRFDFGCGQRSCNPRRRCDGRY